MRLAQESQKSDDMAVKTASMIRTTGEFAMFKRIESSLFCNNGPQSFWLTYDTQLLIRGSEI
jgi:hypothetical protein